MTMRYFKTLDGEIMAVEQGQDFIIQESWVEMTTQEIEVVLNPPKSFEQVVAEYVNGLESYYDSVAQQKKYDDRYTCSLRAGYTGPFQAEGQAFAIWMDNQNVYAYEQLALVESGQRTQPTIEEFVSELDEMVWPA